MHLLSRMVIFLFVFSWIGFGNDNLIYPDQGVLGFSMLLKKKFWFTFNVKKLKLYNIVTFIYWHHWRLFHKFIDKYTIIDMFGWKMPSHHISHPRLHPLLRYYSEKSILAKQSNDIFIYLTDRWEEIMLPIDQVSILYKKTIIGLLKS